MSRRKKEKAPKPTPTPEQIEKSEKAKEQRLRREFNSCSEEYERCLVFQDYKCPVTGASFADTPAYLDHDHATGKLRGLLSFKANKGLALFDDNPDFLRNAADYVENPPYVQANGTIYGMMGRIGPKKKGRKYGPPPGSPKPQHRPELEVTKKAK